MWIHVLLLGLFFSETKGEVSRIKVPAPSLKDNVIGESTERFATIYLPPSYAKAKKKRYPVVYLLHGIGDNDQTWFQGSNGTIATILDWEIAQGRVGEMIVVMPDQRTRFFGSFYTNSPVSGRWEDFTTRDLVNYIDSRYRTLAHVASRGVAGHSMGGYGALMLGMKNPDVFSVVFAMNPALLGWGGDLTIDSPAFRLLPQFEDVNALMAFVQNSGDIYPAGVVCVGQAFSPNASKPPFYMESPFIEKNGSMVVHKKAHAQWEAKMPNLIAPRYRDQLMKLKGYRFDSGYEDEFTHIPVTARNFSSVLTQLGVPHIFEEYNGDHRNRLFGRNGRLASEVFPYFSRLLLFGEP